jgi:myotubularin-related protein 5/13
MALFINDHPFHSMTMDILRRSQLSGYQDLSHPHRFDKHVYTTPTNCNLCGNLLWGPVRNGVRCMDCGNSYHDKCAESAPKNCTKYKVVEGPQNLMTVKPFNEKHETCSIASNNTNSIYSNFQSDMPENRTHEG